ncbi:DUF4231 domain-containing protein [Calothrix sp. CCY 0018]|uniref:DUF4231 domain-containing protein n=1 Tax=Calothrix sp. CCY 0018 TaxID=3103864 RepID=UPI0039C5E1E6
MTNFEQSDQMEIKDTQPKPSYSSTQGMPFPLKVIEYLSLAIFIGFGIIALALPGNPKIIIAEAISLAIFVFLFFIDLQISQTARQTAYQDDRQKKADLYLMNNQKKLINNPITPAREKALDYAQELIKDYKSTRATSRNLYYGLQIGTIILTGVTPILVLVDKLQAGQNWLKWLPVIFPAVASIVASVVTSFPFQENWISANTTVELLEAEQEKFVLGITPLYRCYDSINENEQQKKAKKSIENFITQVNNIHLKQIQETSSILNNEDKAEKPEQEKTEQIVEQSNLPVS